MKNTYKLENRMPSPFFSLSSETRRRNTPSLSMATGGSVTTTKWITTAASIWIQCSAGSSYAFGIYSSLLKSSQSYSQSTLDTVSVFKDIGANAGVLSGLLLSSSGLPWLVHLAGALQCFAGYFFLWAAVTGSIPRPPVPVTCLFMFVAAHAQTFFNTANVVAGVWNFPDHGGTIVGIMKGFLGLSGPVLIQVYQSLFKGKPSIFLLMLALLPTIVSLSLMCFVRMLQTTTGNDKKHLNNFSVIALVLAGYLMIIIILENLFPFQEWARLLTFVLLLFLLAAPLPVAVKAQREDSETLFTERKPLLTDPEPVEFNNSSTTDDGADKNILQAIRSGNFWLLFTAMACAMGSGLATINNISQIGESLRYSTVEINTLVSLWGIWNFLGRFGAGYMSDIFLQKKGWPRPFLMAVALATMSGGHLIVASGFPGNLYLGSVVLGICYGSQWSLMPTITSEIFGVQHMGTIFNTIAIASPVGSYILSVRVIGFLYDKEASSEGNESSCLGTHCFMLSFFMLACVCIFGFLAALALFVRTRRFYKLVVIQRLRRNQKV